MKEYLSMTDYFVQHHPIRAGLIVFIFVFVVIALSFALFSLFGRKKGPKNPVNAKENHKNEPEKTYSSSDSKTIQSGKNETAGQEDKIKEPDKTENHFKATPIKAVSGKPQTDTKEKEPENKNNAVDVQEESQQLTDTKKITKSRKAFHFRDVFIAVAIVGLIVSLVFLSTRNESYQRETPVKNFLPTNSPYTFGIDISHYQGYVQWHKVTWSHHPIRFVIMRASMGSYGRDRYFRRNWQMAKRYGYIRGAYHYFRPGESAAAQFRNFAGAVNLQSGDLPPVLDVEKLGRRTPAQLRREIKIWLDAAEQHYGVRPIIYTGRTFYMHFLKGYFDNYPLWIAAYSGKWRLNGIPWTFHQISDRVYVKGIGYVDGNDFKGSLDDLKALCIP